MALASAQKRTLPISRRVPQQHPDQALAGRLQRDDVFAVGEDNAREGDLVHRADGVAGSRRIAGHRMKAWG
jgi:hypothetical protein